MGFNTTVVILNDQLSDIERSPKLFTEQLTNAIRACGAGLPRSRYELPYVLGQTQVVGTHHASGNHIVSVGGNVGVSLGVVVGSSNNGSDESRLEIVRQLAGSLGYTLRKKPQKR